MSFHRNQTIRMGRSSQIIVLVLLCAPWIQARGLRNSKFVDEQSSGREFPSGPICIDKEMTVEDVEYSEELQCVHQTQESCSSVYQTVFNTVEQDVCKENFVKDCHIEYSDKARTVKVEVCQDVFARNCSIAGDIVCSMEYGTVCETLFDVIDVKEIMPNCQMVKEERCDADGTNCHNVPRMKCELTEMTVQKSIPNTECKQQSSEVCGPETCPLTKGQQACENVIKTVVSNVPQERCQLNARKVCSPQSRILPQLKQVEQCLDVPREICNTVIVPKKVLKQVVKKWCLDETQDDGVININGQTSDNEPTEPASGTEPTEPPSGSEPSTVATTTTESSTTTTTTESSTTTTESSTTTTESSTTTTESTTSTTESTITTNEAGPCPTGEWVHRNESCYLDTGLTMGRDSAQQYCESVGGNLVRIETAEEQDVLVSLLPGQVKHFWISGKKLTDSEAADIEWPNRDNFRTYPFAWVNSGDILPFEYTFWGDTEPNADGVCISLHWNPDLRKWFASSCDNEYVALCEAPARL